MTLDEAIQYAEDLGTEEENKIDYDKDSPHMIICRKNTVKDYKQLAEWLTELKQWRRVYGVCPSYEMCIPECREGYDAQIAEYKRLLKAAVDDMYDSVNDVHCKYCSKWHTDQCQGTSHLDCYIENKFKWRYADEALALLGKDANVPASADDTNVGHKSGGWISCKDKMPEDNTSVLFVYVSENGIKSVHYGYHQTLKGIGSSWAKPSGGWQYWDDDVTHWQPVPEPPKDGE